MRYRIWERIGKELPVLLLRTLTLLSSTFRGTLPVTGCTLSTSFQLTLEGRALLTRFHTFTSSLSYPSLPPGRTLVFE